MINSKHRDILRFSPAERTDALNHAVRAVRQLNVGAIAHMTYTQYVHFLLVQKGVRKYSPPAAEMMKAYHQSRSNRI